MISDWPRRQHEAIRQAIYHLGDIDAKVLAGRQLISGITILDGHRFVQRLTSDLEHGPTAIGYAAATHYNHLQTLLHDAANEQYSCPDSETAGPPHPADL